MSAMRENPGAQRWQKELPQHDRKLLATVVTVLVVYFAGLLVVCYFSLDRSNARNQAGPSKEQSLDGLSYGRQ